MADEANLSMLGDLTCSDPYAPSSGLHTQQGRIAGCFGQSVSQIRNRTLVGNQSGRGHC